jgi:hypothetical protein
MAPRASPRSVTTSPVACVLLITVDMKEDLPAIDPAMLESVTGGTSSDANQQLTVMLQELMSSIKDLASNQNQSGNNQFMQMLPFLMMMQQGRQGPPPAAPIVAPPPGDGWIRVS